MLIGMLRIKFQVWPCCVTAISDVLCGEYRGAFPCVESARIVDQIGCLGGNTSILLYCMRWLVPQIPKSLLCAFTLVLVACQTI